MVRDDNEAVRKPQTTTIGVCVQRVKYVRLPKITVFAQMVCATKPDRRN